MNFLLYLKIIQEKTYLLIKVIISLKNKQKILIKKDYQINFKISFKRYYEILRIN